jgi:flagellar biosynthesis/type III secretory pathway M-ring protein FliF/YscJ
MGGFIERIKNWWLESNPTQRYTTLGGIGLTLVLLFGVFTVASRPKFEMLYGGLSQTDQAAIVTDIQTQGIPVKYDTPGQVEVPSDKVADLRMKLTMSGKVPKGAHTGDEGLGDMNLGTTPTVERERIRAMKEGEMARSIETNPGVRSARVHITLGDPSPFAEQQRPATASVSLITTGQGSISREAARGIAMLVSNSVDGLDMKHVVVLDERSQALYNGGELADDGAMATNKLEMEQTVARKEEMRLQAILDGIYGIGTTKVSVNCEVNMDETRKHETIQQTKKGAITKSMTEKMIGSSPNAIGGAGAESNVQQPTTVDSKSGENYVNTVTQSEPTRIETTTDTKPAVGAVKSMVINVAADNKEDKFGDPQKLTSLQAFIATEIAGKDKSKFVAKVTPMDFDDTTKNQLVKAQDESKSAAQMQQLFSLLPIAALLIVGILVVKQISKFSKVGMVTVGANGQMRQGSLGGAYTGSDESGAQPGSEAYQRAINKYSNSEIASMGEDGIIFLDTDEVVEVEKIREKKSVHLSAIKQMAKDRPEPTAMLIKTWLTEPTPK